MEINLRTPTGPVRVKFDQPADEVTLEQFIQQIKQHTNLDSFQLKSGFPPRPFDLSSHAINSKLADIGIKNKDAFIVDRSTNSSQLPITSSSHSGLESRPRQNIRVESYSNIPPTPKGPFSSQTEGIITRRVIPSDNSCLFHSVAYCLCGTSSRQKTYAPSLRQVCADIVANDPVLFSEAYLGKTPSNYTKFIKSKDTWGGAIELSILSKFYGIQICAFDIINCRTDVYGENENYEAMIFVIYDGIHYDALALMPIENAPEELDTTIFSTKDRGAISRALVFTKQQHQVRQYTDVTSFSLRCLVCQQGLRGEREAQEHAQQTGHYNFSEYR